MTAHGPIADRVESPPLSPEPLPIFDTEDEPMDGSFVLSKVAVVEHKDAPVESEASKEQTTVGGDVIKETPCSHNVVKAESEAEESPNSKMAKNGYIAALC